MRVCEDGLIAHDARQSEVAELHVRLAVYEHITRFQVPMQYFALSVVALEQTQDHLHEDLPGHFFRYMLLLLFAPFDERCHVALLTILHDDVDDLCFAIYYSVVVAHDVWVPQLLQDVHLAHKLLLFFLGHLAVVELFPDEHATI